MKSDENGSDGNKMADSEGLEMPFVLTGQLTEQFLDHINEQGRKKDTIQTYRRCIGELCDFLPEDRQITGDILNDWKEYLTSCGYSDSAVNIHLTAVNGLLRYCKRGDLAAAYERRKASEDMPEMSRAEYLRLLSVARAMGTEREYFLIKVFASVDIGIGELKFLTVESCRNGIVQFPDGKESLIPSCLKMELLRYSERNDIDTGPLFVSRTGHILNRSNITNAIRGLADSAGIDPEKCSPRVLRRLYRKTQEELMERLKPIYIQSYESLLDAEQVMVGWEQ